MWRQVIRAYREARQQVKDDAARRGLLFEPGKNGYSGFVERQLADLKREMGRVLRQNRKKAVE